MAKWFFLLGVGLWGFSLSAAVPSLKSRPEPCGASGLQVPTLSGGKAVVVPSPQGRHLSWRNGSGEHVGETIWFDPRELWYETVRVGAWKDRKGNELTVLKVVSPPLSADDFPQTRNEGPTRENIKAKMDEEAEAFKDPDNARLAKWTTGWTGKDVAEEALSDLALGNIEAARLVRLDGASKFAGFFKPKSGEWHFVEFKLATPAPKDGERLVRKFISGVVQSTAKSSKGSDVPVRVEGKWRTISVPGYAFKTDLPQSQAAAFVKSTGRMMEAMQAAYRRYVPPVKDLGTSTIRVFATREGFNGYMKDATGEAGDDAIGLWSPSHEELLILDRGNSERAETLKTMRHEAFHQYLFYATGCGRHATWFNEGHACFFENVSFDRKKNLVRINDDPTDRRPRRVAEDPEHIAKLIPQILSLTHEEFYAGSLREVNDRYTAAWAVVYFLEKGGALKEFSDYRDVLPTYLKHMREPSADARAATKAAWETVSGREVAADFLKFWGKRTAARAYEPK